MHGSRLTVKKIWVNKPVKDLHLTEDRLANFYRQIGRICQFMFLKYHLKNIYFHLLYLKKGASRRSMEVTIMEIAKTLFVKHFMSHFDLQQKAKQNKQTKLLFLFNKIYTV